MKRRTSTVNEACLGWSGQRLGESMGELPLLIAWAELKMLLLCVCAELLIQIWPNSSLSGDTTIVKIIVYKTGFESQKFHPISASATKQDLFVVFSRWNGCHVHWIVEFNGRGPKKSLQSLAARFAAFCILMVWLYLFFQPTNSAAKHVFKSEVGTAQPHSFCKYRTHAQPGDLDPTLLLTPLAEVTP